MKMHRFPLLALAALVSLGSFAIALTSGAQGEENKLKLDSDWLENFDWRSIGPANMGGRCIAVAVNPDDTSNFWIATASGGLLKTTNSGTTYEHQFDEEKTVSIGHVAVAPSDSKIVWVGTGEANPRNSVSYGDGVYRSTDGGETFQNMGLKKSFQTGRIAIHPENPDIVYVGALGRLYGPNEERGLYKTTDGGKNWERILYVDELTGVIDIDMHPSDPETLIVATYERQRDGFDTNTPSKSWGPGSGIYRTRDGGQTWIKLTSGLPNVELGRIGIDYCRSKPDILMAVVETERSGKLPEDSAYMGMSGEDAEVGARLTSITKEGPSAKAGLEKDDIVLAVDEHRILGYGELLRIVREHQAGDKVKLEIVRDRELQIVELEFGAYEEGARGLAPFSAFLGGQRENVQEQQGRESVQTGGIYKSIDGGDTWEKVNSLNPRPMYYSQLRIDPSDENYVYVLGTSLWRSKDGGKTFTGDGAGRGVHVDHHGLWIDPDDGRHMILGNDGGIFVTHDRMDHWDHHNHVAIGQFYHVGVDNRDAYRVYGGLQDNGSWGGPNRTRTSTGPVNTDWFRVGGGDGFLCRVDPEDPDQVYYESQGGSMGWRNLRTGESGGARPRRERGERYRFNWETPFLLSNHNSKIFYAAGNRVFRSLNRGRDLRPISPEITLTDQGSATALAESVHNSDVLWVGTDDGALWVTRDGGLNWIDLLQPPPAEDEIAPAERRDAVMVQLLKGLDADDDGQVQKSEVPEGLMEVFGQADVNGDGVINQEEIGLLTGVEPKPEEAEAESNEPAEQKPADPVKGTWNATLVGDEVPPGGGEFELVFEFAEKGKWKGKITSQIADGSLDEIAYSAESKKLTFSYSSDEMKIAFDVKLDGEKMKGTLSVGEGDFSAEFEAKRKPGTGAPAPSAKEGPKKEAKKTKKKVKKRGPTIAELLPEPMWVSSLEASRHKEGRVYVTVDGHRSDRDEPYVYASEDYGASWRCLSEKLPSGSSRCLREDLHNENVLYLGTEFGAYVTIDRGVSWTKVSELPTVSVHDFAQHATLGDVVAGTHGRSLWVMDATVLRQFSEEALAADFWLYAPPKVFRWRSLPSPGASGTRRFVGENPRSGVSIYYSLDSRAKQIKLSVVGTGGETLREFEVENKSGLHKVDWDLRQASAQSSSTEGRRRFRGGRRVPMGTYQVVLEVDGRRLTQPLVIAGDPDYPDVVSGFETFESQHEELEEDGEF